MASFRGKMWEPVGNSYRLVGTTIRVYHWNSGEKARYMIEAWEVGSEEPRSMTKIIPGRGQAAKDEAIRCALEIAEKYKKK